MHIINFWRIIYNILIYGNEKSISLEYTPDILLDCTPSISFFQLFYL